MSSDDWAGLSRREREIMNAVFELGEAGAAEVARRLDDDAGYDSIRVTLGILEKKGRLKHRTEDRRNIYRPVVSQKRATQSALRDLTKTFFGGSPSKAILTMLDVSSKRLTEEELDEIAHWIEKERNT